MKEHNAKCEAMILAYWQRLGVRLPNVREEARTYRVPNGETTVGVLVSDMVNGLPPGVSSRDVPPPRPNGYGA